jgi:peptidoglycan/xylan/chitin deacetylase (PgdA/CDA1 family)
MRIPGRKLARRSARWLRSRRGPRAVVLGYHRVTDASPDPYGMHISTANFTEHLEVLHQFAAPLRLRDLAAGVSGGSIPRGAVVVTFDDGYSDNLIPTKRLLERFEVPMTFFVATGALGGEFWWDELERILLFAKRLPAELSLRVGGATLSWRASDPADPIERERLQRLASGWMEPLDETSRAAALEELQRWAGPSQRLEPAHRAATAQELLDLAAGGLVEIGAHSATHPRLARLSQSDQRKEIEGSGKQLRDLLGSEIHSFSYPHGSLSHETVALVREAGYRRACTSDPDVVSGRTDLLRIPRFWIPDCDGDGFARWLRRWL